MPQHLKYIIFVDTDGIETPVVFAPWVEHRAVADGLRQRLTPASAGFVKFEAVGDHGVIALTYGASDSLGLPSRPADAELLQPFLS